jgi:hypothetical protein
MICGSCELRQFCGQDKLLAVRSQLTDTEGVGFDIDDVVYGYGLEPDEAAAVLKCLVRDLVMEECNQPAAPTTGFLGYTIDNNKGVL